MKHSERITAQKKLGIFLYCFPGYTPERLGAMLHSLQEELRLAYGMFQPTLFVFRPSTDAACTILNFAGAIHDFSFSGNWARKAGEALRVLRRNRFDQAVIVYPTANFPPYPYPDFRIFLFKAIFSLSGARRLSIYNLQEKRTSRFSFSKEILFEEVIFHAFVEILLPFLFWVLYLLGELLLPVLTLKMRRGRFDPRFVRKVLIFRQDHIGDAVLSFPVFKVLREAFPRARIFCLCGSWAKEILSLCPDIDELIVSDAPWYLRGEQQKEMDFVYLFALWRRLFSLRPDLTIGFRGDTREVFLAYLSGARYRVDCIHWMLVQSKNLRPIKTIMLLTHKVKRYNSIHVAEHNLNVLRSFLVGVESQRPRLNVPVSFRPQIKASLQEGGVGSEDLLMGIQPGSIHLTRYWPAERYAEVADQLHFRYGARVILTGSSSERQVHECIMQKMDTTASSTAGCDLKELVRLLMNMQLFISTNTGPMHIAHALGIPTIALCGSYSHWFYPLGENSIAINKGLPCSPCGDVCCYGRAWCMEEITSEEVLLAVERLMKKLENEKPKIKLGAQ
jgi:ADP-heptose:LPS heptosyltransferase